MGLICAEPRIMKTLLNTILRLRFLLACLFLSLIVTGCASRGNGNYSFGNRWSGRMDRSRDAHPADLPPPPPPVIITPQAPYVPPPAPLPVALGNTVEFRTDNLWVRKTIDARGSVGSDLATTIILTPLRHIGEVVLNLYVPDNAPL